MHGEHLVDEDAERPPVDALAVADPEEGLGREVLGRAAHGPRAVCHALGEAERAQLEVALGIDQDALRLQIAMHHAAGAAILVQVLEREDELRGVEARPVVLEAPRATQMREEVAAGHVLAQEDDVRRVARCAVERHDEGMLNGREQASLAAQVVHQP